MWTRMRSNKYNCTFPARDTYSRHVTWAAICCNMVLFLKRHISDIDEWPHPKGDCRMEVFILSKPIANYHVIRVWHIGQEEQIIGWIVEIIDQYCTNSYIWPHSSINYLDLSRQKYVHSTHLSQDKMAAISQTIFSDAFALIKSFVFWLKCHWSKFLRVKLTVFQCWLG